MSRHDKISLGRYDYAIFAALFAIASAMQVIPITLVMMSEELGFSLREGGFAAGSMLQIIRWIPGIFASLLCIFIAGRYGKRKTLGVSTAFIAIGMFLCSIAPSYIFIATALMLAGGASGIIGNIGSPFVRDLHPKEPGRYINFINSFWSIGTLCTVLIGGGLLSLGVSWRFIFLSACFVCIVPTILFLLPESKGKEFPEHPEKIEHSETFAKMVEVIKDRRFLFFFIAMGTCAGGESVLALWSASYIQLNF